MDKDKISYSFEPKEKGDLSFDKRVDMDEKITEENEFDENPLSFLTGKTVSLILGILVIALLVPFVIFSVSKSRSTKQNNTSANQTAVNVTPTVQPQPSGTKTQNQNLGMGTMTKGGLPLSGTPVQQVSTKNFTEPLFGYSVTVPSNWEAFKSAGTENAYQITFHQIGFSDRPLTIGGQAGVSENDWINAEYGANVASENAQVGGKNAILVRRPTYISYFTHDNTYTYEISEALGNSSYIPIFNSILSSLKFSK